MGILSGTGTHPRLESQSAQEKNHWDGNFQWNYYSPEDATWEHEENMWKEYPQFFVNFEENRRQDSIFSS
jgi:hypothetical protein